MENVLVLDEYKKQSEECDWDEITSIFQKAIKRKGLSKKEVNHISEKILKEFRGKK